MKVDPLLEQLAKKFEHLPGKMLEEFTLNFGHTVAGTF
jgi:hypothetical protein